MKDAGIAKEGPPTEEEENVSDEPKNEDTSISEEDIPF
jgi:single-strand DNA-binding protein